MTRLRAVELLQDQFRLTARTMAPRDVAQQDDYVSEMTLKVLEHPKGDGQTLGFYANGAVNRAKDFRRAHVVRSDEDKKRRYVAGERSGRCVERPQPDRCKRDISKGPGTRKRGRPRYDPAQAKTVRVTICLTRTQARALTELCAETRMNPTGLYLYAVKVIALRTEREDLAREIMHDVVAQ